MGRIAIFIDAGYLDHVLNDEFGRPRIDYAKLAQEMAGSHDILRTHYYCCLPYQSNPPTADETERFRKAREFHSVLNALPDFQVRTGRLARRGTHPDGSPIFEQKQVDLLMGIDLVQLSSRRVITHAALLTGDSDLIPAVEAAKPDGVSILLFHGRANSYHRELWDAADRRTQITAPLIDRIRRP